MLQRQRPPPPPIYSFFLNKMNEELINPSVSWQVKCSFSYKIDDGAGRLILISFYRWRNIKHSVIEWFIC